MSQQNDNGFKTLNANEALAAFRRVKLSGSQDAYADDEEAALGVTQESAVLNKNHTVKLLNAGGTFKVEAAGAIAAGVAIYPAADGKVEATGTTACGHALEAATAAGDIIECYLTR